MAVPGLTPTSPVTTVVPVLVTVEPPRTAKLRAVPIGGAVCAHALFKEHAASSRTAALKHEKERLPFTIVVSFLFVSRFRRTRLRPGNCGDCGAIFGLERNK